MTDSAALRLRSLALSNFRNLGDQALEPHPRFTLITGENGQGKTNLLEAVHYGLALRPLRSAKLRELLRHGESTAAVQLELGLDLEPKADAVATKLRVHLSTETQAVSRELRRDGNPVDVDGYLLAGAVVAFTPDDLGLIRGAPERRRRMLDRAIFNRWPAYLGEARTYQRLLRSRNQLLRQRAAEAVRESFEVQLWDSAAQVMLRRRDLLEELVPLMASVFERIGLGHGKVSMQYRSLVSGAELRELAAALAAEADLRLATDRERGFTSVGPHTDDVALTLSSRSARLFASQGQARALVLALKVAEIENLRLRLGHAPVLLLDDVSSELDPNRNASFLAYLRELPSQVLLTTTDDASLRAAVGGHSQRWTMAQGIVTTG